jgi:hypothetical protein
MGSIDWDDPNEDAGVATSGLAGVYYEDVEER